MNYINNEKGISEIIVLLAILPIVIFIIIYMIMGGLFLVENNELTTIVNKKLDRAIVEGQFTIEIEKELIEELDAKGFSKDKLDIIISPSEASDNDNLTYIERGNEISISVVYKKAHIFYYFNFGLAEEKAFYPKTKVTGMSEKW